MNAFTRGIERSERMEGGETSNQRNKCMIKEISVDASVMQRRKKKLNVASRGLQGMGKRRKGG